ncbi:MAG TPA: DUF1015 domain-containing protein [Chloroflexota bacterium]
MPPVLPFAGLRYTAPDVELERLVCPPYDVIGAEEQARLQAKSPRNAVHVELPSDAPGQPGSRYRVAAEYLAAWRREGALRADPRPAYYLSETEYPYNDAAPRRRDLLAAVAVEPWSAGVVLPHEHTMAGPKADRLELLRATHLNTSPIWLLHRDRLPALDEAWALAESRPPNVDFTWRQERHRLWLIDDPRRLAAIEGAFRSSGPLYIADGHHRYETSLAFKDEVFPGVPGAAGTLATITWAEDPGLLALPTHRLLLGLDPSLTLEEAEIRWADAFHVEYYPIWDDAPPEQIDALIQQVASSGRMGPSFGVYGLGHLDLFGVLELRGHKPPPTALPADRSDAWKSLDVSLLHALLVDPLIAEVRRPRTELLAYTRSPHEAVAEVRAGRASVAFFLNPTPVQSVLAVADAGDRMPEKSTYFHPKPPTGLVMRDLDVPP